MPYALIVVGLILVITGARNTYADFGRTLAGDFTGPNNFTYWLAALGIVGSLGYIDQLRMFSRAFMALILLSMVLKNGGVFNKVQEALRAGPIAPVASPSQVSQNGSGSSGGDWTDTAGKILGNAAKAALL